MRCIFQRKWHEIWRVPYSRLLWFYFTRYCESLVRERFPERAFVLLISRSLTLNNVAQSIDLLGWPTKARLQKGLYVVEQLAMSKPRQGGGESLLRPAGELSMI